MALLFGGISQEEFISRADRLQELHIHHVTKATADLNAIMSVLGAQSQVSVENVLGLTPQSEPYSVNFVPSEDVAGIFNDDYHGEFQALKEWFSKLRKEATDIFFPFVDSAGGDSADEWVGRAISGQAINLAEDAEFNRGRTRIYEESQRSKQQAAGAVAAMGFSLPTGSLLAARQEADFIANRGMSELNRDLTIRVKELNLDLVKFAVAQVNSLRSVAISGMTSYLNAFASLPGSAAQYAQQKAAAKTALWDAGREYYLAQLSFKNHLLDTNKSNMQKNLKISEMKAGLDDKEIERSLKSLHTAAEVYGRLVAGAMAGITSNVSLDANNNVARNYQWSTTEK